MTVASKGTKNRAAQLIIDSVMAHIDLNALLDGKRKCDRLGERSPAINRSPPNTFVALLRLARIFRFVRLRHRYLFIRHMLVAALPGGE